MFDLIGISLLPFVAIALPLLIMLPIIGVAEHFYRKRLAKAISEGSHELWEGVYTPITDAETRHLEPVPDLPDTILTHQPTVTKEPDL